MERCAPKRVVWICVLGALWSVDARPLRAAATSDQWPGFVALLVDKENYRAELVRLAEAPAAPETISVFRIAIGRGEGDKEREGDLKTPEGIYLTLPHLTKLHRPKYGPRAVPLDFPNPMDQYFGHGGSGIWVHGAGDDERIADKRATEGCIALFNRDIEELKDWLSPWRSFVAVGKDRDQLMKVADISAVTEATHRWAEAWSSRNHERYVSFYDEAFSANGRQKKAYARYKKAVFSSYNKMDVTLSHLRVLTHPKYALAVMHQDFRGDQRLKSIGRKALYWVKDAQGAWRIVRERFSRVTFKPFSLKRDTAPNRAAVSPVLPRKSG